MEKEYKDIIKEISSKEIIKNEKIPWVDFIYIYIFVIFIHYFLFYKIKFFLIILIIFNYSNKIIYIY